MPEASASAAEPKARYGWKFRLLLAIAPRLFYFLSSAVYRTCRITILGKENEDQFLRMGKPSLFVSWHQGLLYYVYHFRNRNGIIMVSQSKDGEIIDRVLRLFGYQSARGSSTRGGKQALDVMIDTIKRTQCSGGLVADAPRGPFGIAKIGTIKLARETGLPLIPVMWWAKRKIMFNSWDKTLLPLPFTRIVFFYEPPIFVPPDTTNGQMEKMRADLTDQLNRMHNQAQEYFGRSDVILSEAKSLNPKSKIQNPK
ncbi:MAG: lysophospholipid acyltransferase family protein [Candidatus Lindowbacteria bacterium]|nr:lysophospholipid acyltransferase family protein [Candidatus Lindowbacteria bacterium]